MRKVLIIAYDFPPAANVGIYRPVKFAKYLPEFGWEPVVLTVSNGKHAKYDESAMKLVPAGTRVYRAWSFELLNAGESRNRHGKPRPRSIVSRILGRLRRVWGYFMVPDDKIGWVLPATFEGYRAVKREGISHVFVTGKPFSSFIIGFLLKRLSGVRLVIDYRDPWTQNLNYLRRSAFHGRIEKMQERMLIRASDVVIANTRVNEEMLVGEFGTEGPREKFLTIHNGFDSEEFAAVPDEKYDEFSITYAGAFYYSIGSSWKKSAGDDVMKTYSPLYFFEALSNVIAKRPDIARHLRVNFMGVLAEGYDSVIREMGLDGVVHRLGYLDHDAHLAVLKKSHAMLLVLSRGEKSRGWIPSKFFSYLGAGNPVLALVPEGEVRDIIRSACAGVFADPDDVDGAAKAIEHLYDEYYAKDRRFDRDEEAVARFDRRWLTARLAEALERAGGRAEGERTAAPRDHQTGEV